MTAQVFKIGNPARSGARDEALPLAALADKLQDENRWLRQELEASVPMLEYRGLKNEIAKKREELRVVRADLREAQKLLAAAIQGSGGTSK